MISRIHASLFVILATACGSIASNVAPARALDGGAQPSLPIVEPCSHGYVIGVDQSQNPITVHYAEHAFPGSIVELASARAILHYGKAPALLPGYHDQTATVSLKIDSVAVLCSDPADSVTFLQ